MSAYEAAMVMHSALRMVLSNQQTLPEINDLRRKLLLTLESETFNSLEPWRTINFDQGKLSQPPTAPIYRITRGIVREDEISDHPWVDISVKQRNALFESPVQVQLYGHRVESSGISLYRVDEVTNQEHLVERRVVQIYSGQCV